MIMGPNILQEAIEARKIASAYYLKNPRVTLIDVGMKITGEEYTGELAVRVHVREKPTNAVFEAFREDYPHLVIDESKIPFPVDIIEASYPIQWFWFTPRPPEPRAQAYNPLQGGISIAGERLFGYGTLGGIVVDRDTGETMILSNWHVLAGSEYAMPGSRILQPGYGDGGTRSGTVALLERHAFAQGIDAAVGKLNGSRGWINDQLDIGPVTGSKRPALGMRVTKSGRASRVTHGIIDGIEGEYPLYYGGSMHRIRFVHRIVPQPGFHEVSRGGDSGSFWLEEPGRQAVGLHFAGQDSPETALAIDMLEVLDSLNVDLVAAAQPGIEAVEPVTAFTMTVAVRKPAAPPYPVR
jgi:hypothetical protein